MTCNQVIPHHKVENFKLHKINLLALLSFYNFLNQWLTNHELLLSCQDKINPPAGTWETLKANLISLTGCFFE